MGAGERWSIDFAKLKTHLEGEYQPLFLKYYGTQDTQPRSPKFKAKARVEARIYAKLAKLGYEVITKPLKYINHANGRITTKGDMDVEITMGIMDNLDSLDTIVLVSGDSDYLNLVNRAHEMGKRIVIVSFDKLLSWELRAFAEDNERCRYIKIESIRQDIERQNR